MKYLKNRLMPTSDWKSVSIEFEHIYMVKDRTFLYLQKYYQFFVLTFDLGLLPLKCIELNFSYSKKVREN